MKLTDTNIIPNDVRPVKVDGNIIYDYSDNGEHIYSLSVYGKQRLTKNSGYPLLARIYFNPCMSAKLHNCIHNILRFDMDGKDCDIDDCDGTSPRLVVDFAGMPRLQSMVTRKFFYGMLCEYITEHMPHNMIDYGSINVFASMGIGRCSPKDINEILYTVYK